MVWSVSRRAGCGAWAIRAAAIRSTTPCGRRSRPANTTTSTMATGARPTKTSATSRASRRGTRRASWSRAALAMERGGRKAPRYNDDTNHRLVAAGGDRPRDSGRRALSAGDLHPDQSPDPDRDPPARGARARALAPAPVRDRRAAAHAADVADDDRSDAELRADRGGLRDRDCPPRAARALTVGGADGLTIPGGDVLQDVGGVRARLAEDPHARLPPQGRDDQDGHRGGIVHEGRLPHAGGSPQRKRIAVFDAEVLVMTIHGVAPFGMKS